MGLPDTLTIFEPKTQRPMNRIRRPKGVVFKPGIHRGKVPKLQFQFSAGLSGTSNEDCPRTSLYWVWGQATFAAKQPSKLLHFPSHLMAGEKLANRDERDLCMIGVGNCSQLQSPSLPYNPFYFTLVVSHELEIPCTGLCMATSSIFHVLNPSPHVVHPHPSFITSHAHAHFLKTHSNLSPPPSHGHAWPLLFTSSYPSSSPTPIKPSH